MTADHAADDIAYDEQRSVLVIADDVAARAAAQTAGRHADLRLVGTIALADAADYLARAVPPDAIVMETAGSDAAAAAPLLATINTLARDRDIDVVVALAEDQVDLITANLFGAHANLLCDPSIAERVAALRWAGALRDHRLHDTARDMDQRLRRLNAEVARFAETLTQLSSDRDRPRFGQVRDTSPGYRAEPDDEPVAATDPAVVRDVIRARRMRSTFFADDLFADPAWDMLLDLYAAVLENRRVSVSSLCIAAAVPGTTALRWIGSMVEAGLFERYADPQDRRRAFISLSATARDGLQRYFHAVRRAGLAPA